MMGWSGVSCGGGMVSGGFLGCYQHFKAYPLLRE